MGRSSRGANPFHRHLKKVMVSVNFLTRNYVPAYLIFRGEGSGAFFLDTWSAGFPPPPALFETS